MCAPTTDSPALRVTSLFLSIDGEVNARGQGTPSFFIRLAGCNLRCWQRFGGALERILEGDAEDGKSPAGGNDENSFPADVQLSVANLLISSVLDDVERWRKLQENQEKCLSETRRLQEQKKAEFPAAMEEFLENRERAFGIRDEAGLMTEEERSMLNDYHRRVYELIGPHLNAEEREWLKEYTRQI